MMSNESSSGCICYINNKSSDNKCQQILFVFSCKIRPVLLFYNTIWGSENANHFLNMDSLQQVLERLFQIYIFRPFLSVTADHKQFFSPKMMNGPNPLSFCFFPRTSNLGPGKTATMQSFLHVEGKIIA